MRRLLQGLAFVAIGLVLFFLEYTDRPAPAFGGEALFLIAMVALAVWPEKGKENER